MPPLRLAVGALALLLVAASGAPASAAELPATFPWKSLAPPPCDFKFEAGDGGVWRASPDGCTSRTTIDRGLTVATAAAHLRFAAIAEGAAVTITVSYTLRLHDESDWAQLVVLANGHGTSALAQRRFGEGLLSLSVPALSIKPRMALDLVLLIQSVGAPEARIDWVEVRLRPPPTPALPEPAAPAAAVPAK